MESLSDHRYIYFEVGESLVEVEEHCARKWNTRRLNKDRLVEKFTKECKNIDSPSSLINAIEKSCNTAMPLNKNSKRRKVHWWNKEVQAIRKVCIACRRKYTRSRQKDPDSQITKDLHNQYAIARKNLTNTIEKKQEITGRRYVKNLKKTSGGKATR